MDENPKTNLAYDAVNFGLYAAAPFTGGATLPFATAMTLAQGAADMKAINIATKTSLFSSNLGLDFLQFKNDLGK